MVGAAVKTTEGDVDERKKRNREESVDIFQRVIRDGGDSAKMWFNDDCDFDPPWIDRLLAFTLNKAMEKMNDLTTKLNYGVEETEMEKSSGELAKLVDEDPRLCDYLQEELLTLLVKLLEHKQNPKVQSHAAIVLRYAVLYSKYKKMVIEHITTRKNVVSLILSPNCEVQMQALCLLRTIALEMSESSKIIKLLEEALTPITSLLLDLSTSSKVRASGSETLAVTCQLYQLPDEKLESVLNALIELLEYNSVNIVPYGCFGLAYLCDARKKMVVQKEILEHLVDRLNDLITCYRSEERVKSIAAATTLGAIVRWGSCSDIEVIIKKNSLTMMISGFLKDTDKWFVKNGCWIVSNIIAKSENHMKAVLVPDWIDSLVYVVEEWKLLDVKKEAAWAISNTVFGAEPCQIEELKHYLVKPLWSLVQSFWKVPEIVSVSLRALIRLEVVEVTCNGRPILVKLQGANTLLTNDLLWLAKLKKLRHADDDSIKISDGEVVFYLTVKTQEDVQNPQIILVYDNLEDVLMYFWGEDTVSM